MAPMGAWPKNARGHATVNAVSPFAFADLGNAPTFSDTKVEIEPAKADDNLTANAAANSRSRVTCAIPAVAMSLAAAFRQDVSRP